MNNNLIIVKDVTAATNEDLLRVLMSAQAILDKHIELQKLLNKAPLVIRAFIEENEGDVTMLDLFLSELKELLKQVA